MSDQNDDTILLKAFQTGDTQAEKAVFDRFFVPLCLFAERITGSLPEAEDIVTDAFLKVIDRREDFPGLRQLKSFLYTTVHNAAVNSVIAERRHRGAHDKIRYTQEQASDSPEQLELEVLRAELISEIYEEIENLPGKCRLVFKMIFIDQLSTEEIGHRLQINPQTVRTQKARAIGLIRTALLKKNRMPTLLLLYALLHEGRFLQ